MHPVSDLRIAAIQTDLHWENPAANRLHLMSLLGTIHPGSTDVIVLPEMFTTGFSMEPERISEEFSDRMDTLQWMRSWAEKTDAAVTGSVAVAEGGRFYNRLLWVRPDGSFSCYDKRHLFRMASEHQHYQAGEKLLVEHWRGWNICPLVCYDLRFPVWSRNRLVNGLPLYDALIYVANWPAARREPWMKLALARAIENQCYVIAVNRTGVDGNGHTYSGDSSVISPRGIYLHPPGDHEQIIRAHLSMPELQEFREVFPVLHDADEFRLNS